ncbi:MAG TPA: hypothetical protein VLF63_02595, partial [Patescibacteria group bacterium]|nr:hypothetical protein [Patescibacteria group bacterium]
MNNFYLSLIFFAVALSSITLKKTYFFLPVTELKRRVKEKDTDSIKLFKVATYDFTFKVIINLIIYLSTAVSILLVGRSTVFATCLLIIFVELYILFSLVPSLKTSKTSVKIASFISPLLALILYYIHPLINRFRFKLKYDSSRTQVNKIYSKADLIKLLSSLNKREHTRLTKKDIELTTNALKFSEKKVSDALISKKQVKTIYDDDVIGPILINEIHESGQNYVLVK